MLRLATLVDGATWRGAVGVCHGRRKLQRGSCSYGRSCSNSYCYACAVLRHAARPNCKHVLQAEAGWERPDTDDRVHS